MIANGGGHIRPEWSLNAGDAIKRTDLHRQFGGRGQGGIGPSAKTPNVFIFTAPVGKKHGYEDGWDVHGVFHYTGEGQRGDQEMKSGNRAILHHEADGRVLRVFEGASGTVTYWGEFNLETDEPWYTKDAPETDSDRIRSVIVFRLRPVDGKHRPADGALLAPSPQGVTRFVPVEKQWTEKAFVDPAREPFEAERQEQTLLLRLKDHLERRDRSEMCRLQILPPGEARPLFTDLFDPRTRTLFEAKGSVARPAIRMAIGQLADYKRFVEGGARRMAVVVPTKPRDDLLALLGAEGIDAVWPDGASWTDTAGGAIVG